MEGTKSEDVLELDGVNLGVLRVELADEAAPRIEAVVVPDEPDDLRRLLVVLGERPDVVEDRFGEGRLLLGEALEVEGLLLLCGALARLADLLCVN